MAVVQWLSEFFVLAKDLTSVSSTHLQWLSLLKLQNQELTPSPASKGT